MLQCQRCLIIPDVHQDVAWATRILERERAASDMVVFLGDYFDSRKAPDARAGVSETCAFLLQTRGAMRTSGIRCVFLLGNHDIQYLEAKPACDAFRTPRNLHNKCGAAFSHSTAKKVAKGLPADFWEEAGLFVAVNGWLLSHAGLTAGYWPIAETVDGALEQLETECASARVRMRQGPQRLLAAGLSRGGMAAVGGLTWLDWHEEFADGLPLPQIVGHTGDEMGARQNGRSWCIDGCQTCYGILTLDSFEVRNV